MLPRIRTQTKTPRTEFPNGAFLLYGQPKVGKSTTAASFPKPLIVNVISENGVAEIAGEIIDIASAQELNEVVRWLAGDPDHAHRGYQTVILDGLTTFCTDVVARSNSKDTRQAVKDATAEIRPALHAFLSLGCIRVLTGHARQDEEEIVVNQRKTTKISVYPDLPPRLRLFVEGRVDAVGYCYAGNGKSQVWWLPVDMDTPRARSISAGNRLGLPRTTDLSFQAIYKALVNGNGNGVPANGGLKPNTEASTAGA